MEDITPPTFENLKASINIVKSQSQPELDVLIFEVQTSIRLIDFESGCGNVMGGTTSTIVISSASKVNHFILFCFVFFFSLLI